MTPTVGQMIKKLIIKKHRFSKKLCSLLRMAESFFIKTENMI